MEEKQESKQDNKPEDEKKDTAKIQPFNNNLDYITTHLDYLRTFVNKKMVESKLTKKKMLPDRPDADETMSEHRLKLKIAELQDELNRKKEAIDARIKLTLAEGKVELPLEQLIKENGLTEFEKMVILIILAPTLDNSFEEMYSELTDTRVVRVKSILELLCSSLEEKITCRKCFANTSKLITNRIINMGFGRMKKFDYDFLDIKLELYSRIQNYLLGEFDVDDEIVGFSSVVEPVIELDQVIISAEKKQKLLDIICNTEELAKKRKEWGFDKVISYGKGMTILFSGPSGTGKTMLAHAIAKATGQRLMLIDLKKILKYTTNSFDNNLELIFKEAKLLHAIMFFDEADELFRSRELNSLMPTLLREIEKMDGVIILATSRKDILDKAMDRRIIFRIDFELPTAEERELIWRAHIPKEAAVLKDIDYKKLATKYELSGGYIKNAVLVASQLALRRAAPDNVIKYNDLRIGAIYQQVFHEEKNVDKIVPQVKLADVILPDNIKEQVVSFIDSARNRDKVFNDWGFGKKLTYGKALSIIFVGPSGVGKTMTAEAIASELGMNLCKVSLPKVMSRFVGDTEKNLHNIFESAKNSKTILFFDEADALFGSRVQDNSSVNSHFINLQTNSLLQDIEAYEGIVILATNFSASIDKAFERRILYKVEFPMPDKSAREEIWRTTLPQVAPVANDINFAELATEFDFSGGTIRNIILKSAFEAARNGQVITQHILEQCAMNELPLDNRPKIGFKNGK